MAQGGYNINVHGVISNVKKMELVDDKAWYKQPRKSRDFGINGEILLPDDNNSSFSSNNTSMHRDTDMNNNSIHNFSHSNHQRQRSDMNGSSTKHRGVHFEGDSGNNNRLQKSRPDPFAPAGNGNSRKLLEIPSSNVNAEIDPRQKRNSGVVSSSVFKKLEMSSQSARALSCNPTRNISSSNSNNINNSNFSLGASNNQNSISSNNIVALNSARSVNSSINTSSMSNDDNLESRNNNFGLTSSANKSNSNLFGRNIGSWSTRNTKSNSNASIFNNNNNSNSNGNANSNNNSINQQMKTPLVTTNKNAEFFRTLLTQTVSKGQEDAVELFHRVEGFLKESDYVQGVHEALQSGDFALLVMCLVACDTIDSVEDVVDSLCQAEGDVLMRAVYKGYEMNLTARQNSVLTEWHSVLTDQFGYGAITRAIFR